VTNSISVGVDQSATSLVVEPTARYELFNSRVLVLAFGAKHDWAGLGVEGQPHIPPAEAIAALLSDLGVKTVYVPRICKANALVIDPSRRPFPETWQDSQGRVTFHRGIETDGVLLRPGTACALRSADCLSAIFSSENGQVVAAHAGLASLVDEKFIYGESTMIRDPQNVVSSALEYFTGRRFNIKSAFLCGIQAKSFTRPASHPTFAENNKRLIRYLQDLHVCCVKDPHGRAEIDLQCVGMALLRRCGVSAYDTVVDNVDTYKDIDPATGEHLYHSWSRTRSSRRNCVVVAHLPR